MRLFADKIFWFERSIGTLAIDWYERSIDRTVEESSQTNRTFELYSRTSGKNGQIPSSSSLGDSWSFGMIHLHRSLNGPKRNTDGTRGSLPSPFVSSFGLICSGASATFWTRTSKFRRFADWQSDDSYHSYHNQTIWIGNNKFIQFN